MDLVMEFSVGERVRVTIGGTYDGEIAKVHSINSKSARLIQSDNSDPTEKKTPFKNITHFSIGEKVKISICSRSLMYVELTYILVVLQLSILAALILR